MTTSITTSIFDIFKIGPGPSSSHTIGPMKAAGAFLHRLGAASPDLIAQVDSVDVYLYGSLSATGLGHGTHKAVLGGLLGWTPEGCDADLLLELLTGESGDYEIMLESIQSPFGEATFILPVLETILATRIPFFLRQKEKRKVLSPASITP